MLGGRVAMPHQFMSGGTGFNSDLFGAENLVIDDQFASTDIRVRRELGANLKQIAAASAHRCHAKGREPLSLRPFWRLAILLNDEPENLNVLPPLDESVEDKVVVLKARPTTMPMPTRTDDERAAFAQRIATELPAFADFLLQWQIPEELRCERYGVKPYCHPDVRDALAMLAPETKLLTLIDATLFPPANSLSPSKVSLCLEMTAEGIEQNLASSSASYEARRLLTWNAACGTYLGRLAKQRPDRVRSARRAELRLWHIAHPDHPFAMDGTPPCSDLAQCESSTAPELTL
jgi:hypothetical protein